MFPDHIKCSLIISLTGDFYKVHRALADTLLQYRSLPQNIEAIIICDGVFWNTIPLLQSIKHNKNIRIITNEVPKEHFGMLFNQGLSLAKGELITFLWPGVVFPLNYLTKSFSDFEENNLSCIFTNTREGIDKSFSTSINYGWLQCSNLISLAGAVFKTEKLKAINGFKEDSYLQRYVDWDVFIRLSKLEDIKYSIDSQPIYEWDLSDYPFTKSLSMAVTKDQVHRSILKLDDGRSPGKIKVTVTGGYWEATHNQLCFYNYFGTERGKEQYSWKSIFDFLATEDEIIGSDLVIISRGKHPNVLNIIDYCQKHNIPTLYMIDDNWFTVAKDWPVYKEIFSPGQPMYEIFIECLKRCDAVILYSPVLEEYVSEYAKKVIRLDINISLEQFKYDKKYNNSRKLIGYSGSPRYSETAFEGLNEFIKMNDEWDLLIFGVKIPDTFKYLKDSSRLHFIHFKNYNNYAKTISEIKPDILLAPLDDNVSSRSKCPNKFLEITAAGAVGIYSDIPPYSNVIINNKNGILISEDMQQNSASWYECITRLANDEEHRNELYQNARDLVEQTYETEARYEEFSNAILSLIKEGRE